MNPENPVLFLLFSASRSSLWSGHRCYHWAGGRKHILLPPIQASLSVFFPVGVVWFWVGVYFILGLIWVIFSLLFWKQNKAHISHIHSHLQDYLCEIPQASPQYRKVNSITREQKAFLFFPKYLSALDLSEAGTRDWCVSYQYQIVISICPLDVALCSSFVSCGVVLGRTNRTDSVIFPWLLSLQDVPCARWLTWTNSLYIAKNHFLLLFMTRFFHLSCFSIFSLLHRQIVMPDWDEAVISSYIRKPYWGRKCVRTEGIFSDSSYFNFQRLCCKKM